jgi:FkbM family methyltransferase
MSLLRTLSRITASPLNRDRKWRAIWRFAKWQLGSRLLPGKVLVDWIDGTRFVVGSGDRGLTGNVYLGLHEFHDMAYVLHVLQPDDWFVDVGANVGSYTLLACGAAGARGYCFEPVPSTYEKLLTNLAVNNLHGKVKHFNQGVGERRDSLAFTVTEDCTNHVVAASDESADTVVVPVLPLDECIIDPPAMMKIDVEGFETMVLRGASRTLQRPELHSLLIELNGSGVRYGFDESQVLDLIETAGFRPFRYDGLTRRLEPLNVRSNGEGNTLFIRDVDHVRRRIEMARRYKVLDKHV